jgi:hypothetical protein
LLLECGRLCGSICDDGKGTGRFIQREAIEQGAIALPIAMTVLPTTLLGKDCSIGIEFRP